MIDFHNRLTNLLSGLEFFGGFLGAHMCFVLDSAWGAHTCFVLGSAWGAHTWFVLDSAWGAHTFFVLDSTWGAHTCFVLESLRIPAVPMPGMPTPSPTYNALGKQQQKLRTFLWYILYGICF